MNTTMIDAPTALSHGLRYLRPGDDGYAAATGAAHGSGHEPALVAMVQTADQVAEAVRHAVACGLGVGVLATGHGTGYPVEPAC